MSAFENRLLRACSIVGLILLLPTVGRSDTIVAYWDFGPDGAGYTELVTIDNAEGIPLLTGMSAGTGYDPDGQSGVSFIDAEASNHSAGQALAWGSGVNDADQEWILALDLTGYSNISIRWDYRSTGSGPANAALDYKIGSNDWDLIDNVTLTADSTYHEYTRDLSSLIDLNDQSDVQLRLSGFSGGSGSGTYRMDNLQITAIPEPAALSFIGLFGGLILTVKKLFY